MEKLLIKIDLWSGVKKQNVSELNRSIDIINWERTTHPEKQKADVDEIALSAILRSVIKRNLSQFEESRQILTSELLNHDR